MKILTLVKTAIATVINYGKDRLKNHWRVNVIIIKMLKKKQKNELLEMEYYDGMYWNNNVIVETMTLFAVKVFDTVHPMGNCE